MAFTDFIVKYDPKTDTPADLTRRILYSLFIRRMQMNFPTICFVGGDSGHGKSLTVIKLQEEILRLMNLDVREYLNDINCYTPLEYPEKLSALLNEKRLKKCNVLAMHEAREIIKAKQWQSFVATAIADVNAQVRSVKRLIIFICSQFIRDITTDVRYTLTYYITCHRPMGGNKRVRARISVMWKDDRDLEKPKLRKRKIQGYIVYPNGRRRKYVPRYLEVPLPPKELVKEFENQDREAKKLILERKINRLIKEMRMDLESGDAKVDAMVGFYSVNMDRLQLIGKYSRGKWKLHEQVQEMHDMTKTELKQFQTKLNEALVRKGMMAKVEGQDGDDESLD